MGITRLAIKLICVCLLVLAAISAANAADPDRSAKNRDPAAAVITGPISLAQALDIAGAGNLDLAIAVQRIENAAAAVKRAQSGFYPTVGLSFEYMQGDAPSQFLFKTIDQRKLQPNTDFNQPGWFENYETGAVAKLNLFNGNRDRLGLQMAKSERATGSRPVMRSPTASAWRSSRPGTAFSPIVTTWLSPMNPSKRLRPSLKL